MPCRTRRRATCATRPALRCLANAGVKKSDIDLLVLADVHADMSVSVDGLPGAGSAAAELCGPRGSGSLRGFHVRAHHRSSLRGVGGEQPSPLVIGGDRNSRILNPHDIKTYPLFGDGAGAVLVAPWAPGRTRDC